MADSKFCNSDFTSNTKHVISKRAEMVREWEDFLNKYLSLCNSDPYDPEKNPLGYINLGTAVNNICNDLVYPKITSHEIWNCDTTLLQYDKRDILNRLRKALATLMTELLHTREPVDPNDLFFSTGVTGCIDVLVHCLADPGDVIMAPTPIYGRIYTDFLQRSLIEMWPIPIITKDDTDSNPVLTMQKIKDAYHQAKDSGKNVRGIMLLNPSNPLGDVYGPQLVLEILEFCNEKEIHAIVDEVYALSIHSKDSQYRCVLALPSLPNPEMTHILYGMSKDFSMAGLRIGAIHTKCHDLQRCLTQLSFFQEPSFPVMAIAARIWEDLDWCQNFVHVSQQRLQEKHLFCKERIEKMGLSVRNSEAAFFVWVDFRKKCNISTFAEEIGFFNFLIEKYHLYIVPGKELFCEQPGWFRITFTGQPEQVEVGLERLEAAIKHYLSQSRSYPEVSSNRDQQQEESLENLMKLLQCQIKDGAWLSENTADKWMHENPDLQDLFLKEMQNQ